MALSSWADIEDDLLIVLAERIVNVATFIRFSAVCKSWYSIASATKCSNPVPWLMLAEKQGSDLHDFYDHSIGELYQISVPKARDVMIVGSCNGWLMTTSASEDDTFHLLNPLNGTQIALPFTTDYPLALITERCSLEGIRDCFIIRAACSPIHPNGDYMVAAVHMDASDWFLSCWRSTHRKWTVVDNVESAKSVNFVGDNLYMVTRYGDLYRIKISTNSSVVERIAKVPQGDGCRMEYQCYTLECDGTIFLVSKQYTGYYDVITKHFEVFKLNKEGDKLSEITDIGNYALFLGRSFSVALHITPSLKNIKRNHIYYIDDRNEEASTRSMECGSDMGMFDIKNKSMRRHYPIKVKNWSPSMPIWVAVDLPTPTYK